ncbi:diacylglycerol kinase [Legionella antarctica]|uniref:Diacylglycerol kinase n=1 Tax=Legionella antarctica TaxID=2708020 RepID=A0A6F8TA84_9GAMM|nr:diacylglycerol kinase [Legionella antarctica]BCA96972.1 diacylglycerol kinase [Legionella antarctica]
MIQSILHLYKAFKNSWKGLKNAWCLQWAFRVEVALLLIAFPCAFLLGNNTVEYILLLGSVFLLLIMELINSAIETIVNRIGLEYHELSGLAKDLASSAILLSILNMLMTWGIIFIHQI